MTTNTVLWMVLTVWMGLSALRISRGGEMPAFGLAETRPLRGALALLVMLGHIDGCLMRQCPFLRYIHWATPAVAVFFFLSGYGLVKSADRKPIDGLNLSFLWRSAVKLFVPLLVIGFLFVLAKCLTGQISPQKAVAVLTSGRFVFIPHSWYVRALFVMYVFFWLSRHVVGFSRGGILLMVGLVTGYWLFVRFGVQWGKWWRLTCFSILFGMGFAVCEGRIRAAFRKHPFPLVALLSLALLAAGAFARVRFPHVGRLEEGFLCLLGPCVYFCLSGWNPLVQSRILDGLGVYALEIYLVHGTFEKMLKAFHWHPGFYVVAVIGATLLCVWPVHLLCGLISRSLQMRRLFAK